MGRRGGCEWEKLRYLTQSHALERNHLLIRVKRITHRWGNTFNQLCTLNTLLSAAWALITAPRPPSPPHWRKPPVGGGRWDPFSFNKNQLLASGWAALPNDVKTYSKRKQSNRPSFQGTYWSSSSLIMSTCSGVWSKKVWVSAFSETCMSQNRNQALKRDFGWIQTLKWMFPLA